MLKRKDIRVRDPYIVNEGGVCYMYATTCGHEIIKRMWLDAFNKIR